MSGPPTGLRVRCPECNSKANAIVPQKTTIVEQEADADGKVWVNCRTCGERFLAYYRKCNRDTE